MAWRNVGVDAATAGLLKAAQAALLGEDLPAASGKTLVALCRSVRLYLEAGDQELALLKLDAAAKLVGTVEDDIVRRAFDRHVETVRTRVTFKRSDA
jgi:hypothetical protein